MINMDAKSKLKGFKNANQSEEISKLKVFETA